VFLWLFITNIDTSRSARDGEQEGREYHFVKRDHIQKEIDKGGYVEWGEYNGNLYGTSVQSVRDVIRTGRVCVLDCSPQAAKYLYTKVRNILFAKYFFFAGIHALHCVHPAAVTGRTQTTVSSASEPDEN
jgi:guanylate kinase